MRAPHVYSQLGVLYKYNPNLRIIGNDLTGRGSMAVNHQMGGSSPLLPAKQMLTDQLLGQLERCKRLAEDMWFDSIRQHQLQGVL